MAFAGVVPVNKYIQQDTLIMPSGLIFDIKKYAINDGPGIRVAIFLRAVLCVVHGVIILRVSPPQRRKCITEKSVLAVEPALRSALRAPVH